MIDHVPCVGLVSMVEPEICHPNIIVDHGRFAILIVCMFGRNQFPETYVCNVIEKEWRLRNCFFLIWFLACTANHTYHLVPRRHYILISQWGGHNLTPILLAMHVVSSQQQLLCMIDTSIDLTWYILTLD